MSVEQAKAFIEKMKTDEAFREKVMNIEDAAGRIACIQNEGFSCTAEEINEVAHFGAEFGVVGGGWKQYRWVDPGNSAMC
ncbi:MAG: Nif11-like leader peptide family natural product precursor [Chlorobiaceae bacterium]|nr:Nif11-like leader peptide family natural product precursor [Chlorobiaceae bacterium]